MTSWPLLLVIPPLMRSPCCKRGRRIMAFSCGLGGHWCDAWICRKCFTLMSCGREFGAQAAQAAHVVEAKITRNLWFVPKLCESLDCCALGLEWLQRMRQGSLRIRVASRLPTVFNCFHRSISIQVIRWSQIHRTVRSTVPYNKVLGRKQPLKLLCIQHSKWNGTPVTRQPCWDRFGDHIS